MQSVRKKHQNNNSKRGNNDYCLSHSCTFPVVCGDNSVKENMFYTRARVKNTQIWVTLVNRFPGFPLCLVEVDRTKERCIVNAELLCDFV